MKKLLVLVCVVIMALTIVGCQTQQPTETTVPSTEQSSVSSEKPEESTSAAADNGFAIQPKNGNTYKVGVVVKTLESAFYQNMANALEEKYKGSDTFELIVQASKTETDTAGFIQVIEDMITKDVDVLIVVPGDPDAVQPTLENVIAAGIPVICSETDVPDLGGKLTYIGIDNVASGGAVVDYVFKNGLVASGNECAVITGPVGYTTADDRAKGAVQAIEANGGVIVGNQPADWDRTKGLEVAENIITANPNLKYIAASNGEMALGAAEAIASASMAGKILVTGFDGIMDEYYAIQDGRLAATILQDSRQYGLLAMEKYIAYLKGETLESVYSIDCPLVTPDNVKDFIANSAE